MHSKLAPPGCSFPFVAFFDPSAGSSFPPPLPLPPSFPPLLPSTPSQLLLPPTTTQLQFPPLFPSTPSHLLLPPTTTQLQRRKLRRLWRRVLDVVSGHLKRLPRRDGPDPLYAHAHRLRRTRNRRILPRHLLRPVPDRDRPRRTRLRPSLRRRTVIPRQRPLRELLQVVLSWIQEPPVRMRAEMRAGAGRMPT